MRRAIILSLNEDTSEMKSLLATLEVSVIDEIVQKRARPHTVSYLGPGKMEEVKKNLDGTVVDLIVVDGTLKPSQHHHIEMMFQMECMDRVGVILRIFAEHAHTPEATAQVALAKFRYELPFLREWIHKAKSGDRPGFLAGGAYATDVYYEHARKQMNRIEKYLERVSRERDLTRARRRAGGYTLVCLSGYTNAGKSSLLNSICGSQVDVDHRLFSTLATTTRKVPGVRGNILMTDTVGFIKDLPPDLIDAFKSTLEEIFRADVILLVFDVGEDDEEMRVKLSASLEILLPQIQDTLLIGVGSKIDGVADERRVHVEKLAKGLLGPRSLIFTSAETGEGIEQLKGMMSAAIDFNEVITASLPVTDEAYRLISRLHARAEIESAIEGERLVVTIRCRPEDRDKILGWLNPLITKNPALTDEGRHSRGISSGNGGGPL